MVKQRFSLIQKYDMLVNICYEFRSVCLNRGVYAQSDSESLAGLGLFKLDGLHVVFLAALAAHFLLKIWLSIVQKY